MISDLDFPNIREVDLKLIEVARNLMGRIVTNDFNLNKVAQLRGVDVLNINELANALKPVVLPGETMNVFVIKEGKEYNQGVAHQDWQESRHRRHERAADHCRANDLRTSRRTRHGSRRTGIGSGANRARRS